jgi:hypothetical protein
MELPGEDFNTADGAKMAVPSHQQVFVTVGQMRKGRRCQKLAPLCLFNLFEFPFQNTVDPGGFFVQPAESSESGHPSWSRWLGQRAGSARLNMVADGTGGYFDGLLH